MGVFLELVNGLSLHDGGYQPKVQQTPSLLAPSSPLVCRSSLPTRLPACLSGCRLLAAPSSIAPTPDGTWTLEVALAATGFCDSLLTPPTCGRPKRRTRDQPVPKNRPHAPPSLVSACILHRNVSQLSLQPSLHAHSLPSAPLLVRDNTPILHSQLSLARAHIRPSHSHPLPCVAHQRACNYPVSSTRTAALSPLPRLPTLAAFPDSRILVLPCATRQTPAFFACDLDPPGCAR
ncbi:hypothetical protein DE146DRAFT_140943 [Phaeosphaeria sp. MPI-PUGE-AT-0046c]|nr:hypothetical protein DE146DRAFT_140943 [Phaeosphaeria sp. MPI-PUGE-AT-0046c]